MIDKLDEAMDFQTRALKLRGYRQQLLASNVANGDTPNYKAVDIDFASALRKAAGARAPLATTSAAHVQRTGPAPEGVPVRYRGATQPSIDGNTVDMDVERSQFVDNAVRYEAAVQVLNAQIRMLTAAIKD